MTAHKESQRLPEEELLIPERPHGAVTTRRTLSGKTVPLDVEPETVMVKALAALNRVVFGRAKRTTAAAQGTRYVRPDRGQVFEGVDTNVRQRAKRKRRRQISKASRRTNR